MVCVLVSPGDENQGASNVLAKNSYSAFTDDTVFCYVDFLKRSDPSAAHTFKIHVDIKHRCLSSLFFYSLG